MNVTPATCALLAQIVPVFLLTFAVRGSHMARSSADDVRRRPRRSNKRFRWSDPRLQWAFVVLLFIGFEAFLVAAAEGIAVAPAVLVWTWFGLVLLYAGIEFWISGVAKDPVQSAATNDHDS
ncbi:MAG: hypothetical protein QM779_13800 [Propionicimonas sp.]|uniref:hypothetical protein n=1 Tax=Propionicimonas sp. TaxID=1955623 RepID=UPI003D0D66E8